MNPLRFTQLFGNNIVLSKVKHNIVVSSVRQFSKKKDNKKAKQQNETKQQQLYVKMQETLRKKEENRELRKTSKHPNNEATLNRNVNILNQKGKTVDKYDVYSSKELYRNSSHDTIKKMDQTINADSKSGHFKDEKNSQFTPQDKKSEDNIGLTTHDVIFSLNSLTSEDLLDIMSRNAFNSEVMEKANIVDRIGTIFESTYNEYIRGNIVSEKKFRKLFQCSLNIVENHPELTQSFLEYMSLEKLESFLYSMMKNANSSPSLTDEMTKTDIACRMLSLALIGSIVYNDSNIAKKLIQKGFLSKLQRLLQILKPETVNLATLSDTTIEQTHASETYLELERLIKIFSLQISALDIGLKTRFVEFLSGVIQTTISQNNKIDITIYKTNEPITSSSTIRILSLIHSIGNQWESTYNVELMDMLADEFINRDYYPLFLKQISLTTESAAIIFHRLLVYCIRNDPLITDTDQKVQSIADQRQTPLELLSRTYYSEIISKILLLSHSVSRETHNGMFLAVHIASLRSLLERQPYIKKEYIKHDIVSTLIKIAYENTEFPPTIDSSAETPVDNPEHYSILPSHVYFNTINLINLLTYHSTDDDKIPLGVVVRTIAFATTILPLSEQHAYGALRILMGLIDNESTLEAIIKLETIYAIIYADELYGKDSPAIRFHVFTLFSSIYSSCPTDFLKATIREDVIPSIVRGIQPNTLEVAVHSIIALGRIIAIMEGKKKSERDIQRSLAPDILNSAIPYRRIMISAGLFNGLKSLLADSELHSSIKDPIPDGLKSIALRFLTTFFCHPPALNASFFNNYGIPLYQKAIQDGSRDLVNSTATYLSTLCDHGFFEAIIDSTLLSTCLTRLNRKETLPVNKETSLLLNQDEIKEISQDKIEMRETLDYNLTELFKFVNTIGQALASNARNSYQANLLHDAPRTKEIKLLEKQLNQKLTRRTDDSMMLDSSDPNQFNTSTVENITYKKDEKKSSQD